MSSALCSSNPQTVFERGTETLAGTGVGLRGPHVPEILRTKPGVPWFELLTDNHLAYGGALRFQATAIAEHYPVALHGVGMSLGGTDPLNWDYIEQVRKLSRDLNAVHVSEHLSFSADSGTYSHELLPLPRTEEVIRHVCDRIEIIQDYLGQRLLIENVSTYLEFRDSSLTEAEFLGAVCARADCDLLLDVNNLYVNCVNHDYNAEQSLAAMPWSRVKEVHVAGHSQRGQLLLDSHGGPIDSQVTELLALALTQIPEAPVLVEWDTELPDWGTLWAEGRKIETVRTRAVTAANL